MRVGRFNAKGFGVTDRTDEKKMLTKQATWWVNKNSDVDDDNEVAMCVKKTQQPT